VHGYRAARDPICRSAEHQVPVFTLFRWNLVHCWRPRFELSPAIETHTAAAEMAASKRVIH
jgi:hypothetical protein